MTTQKKLIVIGIISFIISLVVFFTAKADYCGYFSMFVEIMLVTVLTFIILAVNFFVIVALIKGFRKFF